MKQKSKQLFAFRFTNMFAFIMKSEMIEHENTYSLAEQSNITVIK